MDARFRTAVVDGDVVAVVTALDTGMPIDARDRYGQTALMLAAVHGRDGVVAALLTRGAALDVTAKFGLSALMLACVAGHDTIAAALVAAGADTTLRGTGAPGFHGKTAADLAAARRAATPPATRD